MDRDHRRLSEADRRLLDSLVRKRLGASAGSPEMAEQRAAPGVDHSRWLGFETLQGYAEQRLLRSAGAAMGLAEPYFLLHEGCAGAHTVIDGRRMLNFSSYDYLGLNRHPDVRSATHEAVDRYGISASASRLVAGRTSRERAAPKEQ